MTCAAGPPTFRLLDAYVGWDEDTVESLVGLADPAGLRLSGVGGAGLSPGDLWPYLVPPRLAWDCPGCTWFLATPDPPASRILRLGPCDETWQPLDLDPGRRPAEITSLAVRGQLVAAVEPGGRVWVWSVRTGLPGPCEPHARLEAVFEVCEPVAVAFASACELLVATAEPRIWRYDFSGCRIGELPVEVPGEIGAIENLAVDAEGSVWLVTRRQDRGLALWRAACGDQRFAPATVAELAAALPPTGLTVVDAGGFCIRRPPKDPNADPVCYTWYGRPPTCRPPAALAPPALATHGQLLTAAIDSGLPRCRWHRVRIDAEVPEGTTITAAVATSEEPTPTVQGQADPDPAWAGFAPGVPHPEDWQQPAGARDFLVDQPPGRYLFVRLRLAGDGQATPVVRRVRLDFPRATSLDFLPAVYRDEPRAEDFSERFLALFDAAIADLDRAVERFPALFDGQGVPDEVLPWLARFLDLTFDPAWEPARRRRILAALPALYRRRGTVAGLAEAVELVFDAEPVIEELGLGRFWGAVAPAPGPLGARLGSVRLFGRSRARARLDRSRLGTAPLRSWGDPDLDPLTAGAHRFRVLLPGPGNSARERRLGRLVASQKPAHTTATVRLGNRTLVLAGAVRLGIDTRLAAPEPPALGVDLRLGRSSILRGGPPALKVGQTSVLTTS